MREINCLSVQQWLRSAISDSQQPNSPIGFLFLKLPPPPCAVLLVYVILGLQLETWRVQLLRIVMHSQTVPDPPLKFAAQVWRIIRIACSVASAKCSHRGPRARLRSECNIDICLRWYTRIREVHHQAWCGFQPCWAMMLLLYAHLLRYSRLNRRAGSRNSILSGQHVSRPSLGCSFWCEVSDRVANLVPLCPALCVWVLTRSRSVDFEPFAKNKDVDVQKAEPGSEMFKMPSILSHNFSSLCGCQEC